VKEVKPKGKTLKDKKIYGDFIDADDDSAPISRRDFIKSVGVLAGTPMLGSFLAGCTSSAPAEEAAAAEVVEETYTIRIGYLPATHDSIFFSAMEAGYFKELGVKVEPYIFYSGGKMGEATAAGKLDAFIVGSTAPMYYISKGAGLSIVGGDAFYGSAVVTNPEDVGMFNKKDINVFRDANIATIRLGTADGIWRGYLWDAGIRDTDGGDMTTLNLGSPGDVVAAVRGGKASGGLVWEPYVSLADLEGYPPSFWIKWLDPHSCCRTSMNDNFLSANKETAVRFQQAMMMAERDYYYNPANHEEFIQQSDVWLRIGYDALQKGLFYREPALDRDFRLRLGSGLAKPNTDRFAEVIQDWLGWSDGLVSTIKSKIDPSVNMDAAKRLGHDTTMAARLTEMNPDSRNYLKAVGVEDSVIEKNFFVK
jgi:ABC-type nitrate/sulfonate/bicarbonate transport system substrate-binding protein